MPQCSSYTPVAVIPVSSALSCCVPCPRCVGRIHSRLVILRCHSSLDCAPRGSSALPASCLPLSLPRCSTQALSRASKVAILPAPICRVAPSVCSLLSRGCSCCAVIIAFSCAVSFGLWSQLESRAPFLYSASFVFWTFFFGFPSTHLLLLSSLVHHFPPLSSIYSHLSLSIHFSPLPSSPKKEENSKTNPYLCHYHILLLSTL